MKFLLYTTFFVIILFFSINNNSKIKAKQQLGTRIKFCKLDVFLECLFEPLAYFTSQTNGTGIANSDEEMEQFCFNLHDYFPVCAKQWAIKCGSPLHVELLTRFLIEPFRDSFRDFCNSNSSTRSEFLKYSNCLIHQVKLSPSYKKNCVRTFQAGQEFIFKKAKSSLNMTEIFRAFCCSYNNWENCIVAHLTNSCGEASAQVFPSLIHHGSMMVLKSICPKSFYDSQDLEKCNKSTYIAPLEYKPKGLQSRSLASYLFSKNCPNVGFNIIPEKDF